MTATTSSADRASEGPTEAEYATIGRKVVAAVNAVQADYPHLADWTPAECYSEIVGDLADLSAPEAGLREAIARLKARLREFDDEVAAEISTEGERADLWSEIEVNVDDLRAMLSSAPAAPSGGDR